MKKRTLAIFLGLLNLYKMWRNRGRGPGTQVDRSNLHKSEGVQPLRSRKRESTGS